MHSSRMCTARLLTVSHSIPFILGESAQPPLGCRHSLLPALLDADPPPCRQTPSWRQTPLDADPLVMWPVMHAGKPNPPPHRIMLVKILPCPKLRLRAVIKDESGQQPIHARFFNKHDCKEWYWSRFMAYSDRTWTELGQGNTITLKCSHWQ